MDAKPDDTIAYGCETEDPIHDDSDHNANVLADCSALNDYTQEASIVNIDSHRETDQHEISEDVEMSSTYDDTEFVEDQSVPHEDTDEYTLDSTEDIPQQMTDLRHFLTPEKSDPLGIDRTFNLGSFYVTTIVYKNQRVVRKERDRK